MNSLGDGVYILNEKGFLINMNSEAEKILGWRLEEIEGEFIHDIIHCQKSNGEILPFEECPISISMRLKRMFRSNEEIFIHKEGNHIEVSLVASPLIEDDVIVGSVACFRDISDIVKIQEELITAKKNAENSVRIKSDFLSTMSHEIRTPMNGVIVMADLLLDTHLNEQQLEFTNIIKASSNLLLTIINDILDFSKIEAGQLKIETIEFSLQEVLESSADMVSTHAYDKSLSLMTFIDPNIPISLLGDPIRISQILLNLLNNAIKFTSHGNVVLRATLLKKKSNQDVAWIHIEVSDTGLGISNQEKENLFKPFSQADSSTTRKYGGTGLGLSISKRLVELMGGIIDLTSIKGSGSTFWIEVPFKISLNKKEISISKSRDIRILVVGVNSDHNNIISTYLSAWGCLINTIDNVDEILLKLNDARSLNHDYDVLILADLKFKNILIVIDTIRTNTYFRNIPIIACQDIPDHNYKQELLNQGVSSVLIKPVKQSALFDSIVNIFHSKEFTEISKNVNCLNVVLPKSIKKESENQTTSPTILLVEDNLVNQQVAQHLLKKLGYNILIANNGEEALNMLENSNYELILMDCQMPVMDGFETTKIIRQREAQKNIKRIPIIAMTANAIEGDKDLCLKTGMDDYITKPISMVLVHQILKQWLPKQEIIPDEKIINDNTNIYIFNDSPIDRQRLITLFDDDTEIINELLDVFCDSLASLKVKLSSAFNARSDSLKTIAHEIKGSSYNVGALGLAALSEQLERISVEKNWIEIEKIIAKIHTEINRTQHFIKNNK